MIITIFPADNNNDNYNEKNEKEKGCQTIITKYILLTWNLAYLLSSFQILFSTV